MLPWQDLLLLLEGQPVHFSAPKTHCTQDIAFEKDTPIFCTSKSEIVLIKGGVVDDIETQMMSVRWQVYSLYAQVLEPEQVILSPFSKSFARLIILEWMKNSLNEKIYGVFRISYKWFIPIIYYKRFRGLSDLQCFFPVQFVQIYCAIESRSFANVKGKLLDSFPLPFLLRGWVITQKFW